MKKVLLFFMVVMMIITSSATLVYGETSVEEFSDIENHWAKDIILNAKSQGWVDGYEDKTFQPDKSISRAEYVKLIIEAVKLTDSATTKFLLDSTRAYRNNSKLNGVEGHWINKGGWIDSALAFGLVVPSDYFSNNFEPDKTITRREMAVIINRIMGLVEASEKDKGIQLSFKDNMDIPDWVKGYIYHAAEANLIKGYTDGTFRHDNLATRAEAVTMISNALSTMNEGIDTSYKVLVQGKELSLNTPVHVINDIAYVPVREIIQAANPDLDIKWEPVKQYLYYDWEMVHILKPNKLNYEMNGLYGMDFPAKSKMLNGELMFPLGTYLSDYDAYYLGNLWSAKWDKTNKTIDINVIIPMRPNPS